MELFAKKNNIQPSHKTIVNRSKIIALSRVSVQVDWIIALSIFVMVFCGVIVLSIVQYLSLQEDPLVVGNYDSASEEIISTAQLNRVVADYRARAGRFEALVPGFVFTTVDATATTVPSVVGTTTSAVEL